MGSKSSKESESDNKDTEDKKETSGGKSKYLDPEYRGEPLPDELSNGPVEKRKCTDCLCCLVFIAFLVAWFICGIVGFSNGKPYLLTYPFDSDGNQCGLSGDGAEHYGYLYFPFPISGKLGYRACVKECPSHYNSTVDCYKIATFNYSCEFLYEDSFSDPDPIYGYIKGIYPSNSYLKRFCLPDVNESGWVGDGYKQITGDLDISVLSKWIADVWNCWEVMFIVAAFAIVVAVIYLILMRYFLGLLVWLSIILVFVFLILLAAFLNWAAANKYQEDTDKDTRKTLNIIAYILYAVSGLYILYILCMCNRIRLAIAIMKAGTVYIKEVWQALFVPPVFFVVIIAIYVWWILATIWLYASGDVKQRGNSALAEADWNTSTRNAFYFEFFGILWINAFLISLCQFILAGSVCIWYFSSGSDSGAHRPISRSLWWAFRYHLGTLAFGSFILAVVWTIKYILMYVQAKIKATGVQNRSKAFMFMLRCVTCYVLCFERFIKFLNKNAFIQCALNSTSFCCAARDAFFLILRNGLRFLALGTIGHVFMFLGRWVIALVSTYAGYMIITHASKWEEDLHSPVFPTIVFLLISYVIASLFMSVYGMACDAILHCFLADEELCKKNDRPPQHAPEMLRDFLDKERKKESKQPTCCCCC